MSELRYREALNRALREEMLRDHDVFLMGEDIGVFDGAFKVTEGLLEEFGERRVRDTPISENSIVGMGVGAAMLGLRPVVELMTINFSLLAMDQIVNHAAHIRYMFGGSVSVPMVVRMPQGAGNQLGPTHSHCFEALYAERGEVPEGEHLVRFGKAAVRREGSDLTIVGISRMARTAERAAERLADEHGISAEVIDPRTLRPLDLDTILTSVAKTNRCIVVEEGWPHGGVAANLAALIQEHGFDDLDAPVMRVSGADVPMPYAKALERLAFPDVDAVVAAARRMTGEEAVT